MTRQLELLARQRGPRPVNAGTWGRHPACARASRLPPPICSTCWVCGLGGGFLSSCALPAVDPAVRVWGGGAWPLAAGPAGCRGWGPVLTSQGPFFPFNCQASGASLNIILREIFGPASLTGPLASSCLHILGHLVFPTVPRALTPGWGHISLPESLESSGARQSWTVLVCGNASSTAWACLWGGLRTLRASCGFSTGGVGSQTDANKGDIGDRLAAPRLEQDAERGLPRAHLPPSPPWDTQKNTGGWKGLAQGPTASKEQPLSDTSFPNTRLGAWPCAGCRNSR